MKQMKFPVDDELWEDFYRAFPSHGERTALLRKIVRKLVTASPRYNHFITTVSNEIIKSIDNPLSVNSIEEEE